MPDSDPDHQSQWRDEEDEALAPETAPAFYEGDAKGLSSVPEDERCAQVVDPPAEKHPEDAVRWIVYLTVFLFLAAVLAAIAFVFVYPACKYFDAKL